jgi:carotenoid cleavage dioxygenase-like enzyme
MHPARPIPRKPLDRFRQKKGPPMAAVLQFPNAAADHRPGRLRGFQSGAREFSDTAVAVTGTLPNWLRGRFLLNGPALWDLPHGRYEHWFDGLAMLHAVHFGDEGVSYRSRYLQSEDYVASIAAGKPAMGGFGTDDPPGLMRRISGIVSPRITDNAAVVMSRIGRQWVATTETPRMVGFDAVTLDTTGPIRFDDQAKIHLMSAHGIGDAQGNYWNVGVELGPKCVYKLFRIRPAVMKREVVAEIKVPASGYLHAFAMTRRHAIVWETALRAQALGFVFTGKAYIRNFKWQPEMGSMIHAVSLADGKVTSWQVPAMLAFHAVQAYERGDETVLELSVFDDAKLIDDLGIDARREGRPLVSRPALRRYRLQHGKTEAVMEEFGVPMDQPQVHPDRWAQSQAAVAWGTGVNTDGDGAFFDRTLRIDLATGEHRMWRRANAMQLEPIFVPRPGSTVEDDGVLLVPTLADEDVGSVIAVVDASTMQCMATVAMPQVIPFGFHAAFE